jgi:hypothetical protein
VVLEYSIMGHACSGLPSCVALVVGLAFWKGWKSLHFLRGRDQRRTGSVVPNVGRARCGGRLKCLLPNLQIDRTNT